MMPEGAETPVAPRPRHGAGRRFGRPAFLASCAGTSRYMHPSAPGLVSHSDEVVVPPPEPVDPEPVDPEPVDPEPVDPEPVDPVLEPDEPELELEPDEPEPDEPELTAPAEVLSDFVTTVPFDPITCQRPSRPWPFIWP